MFLFRDFIRRTPADPLRSYFIDRYQIDPKINWAGGEREVRAELESFVAQLPPKQGEQVHADLEQVHQLCDEVGQRALRSAIVGDLKLFDTLDGAEARGLSVLVSDPIGFRRALSIAYSSRHYHGRNWSRYYVSTPDQPSNEPEAEAAFEAEIKQLFIEIDGSGRQMIVESFERTGEGASSIIYSILVEAPPVSIMEFSDAVPRRATRRPVIEAALSYSPTDGMLDIVSKGGKRARERIGDAFVHNLLRSETELLPVSPRTFVLERLRQQTMFDTDPGDGIKDVSVTALRLRDLTDPISRITIETASGGLGIHALAQRWFGDANPLTRDDWQVEHARLQILFHPDRDGSRENRVTIELRAPNGSNLKEQMRRHELVSSKYLARWGLIHAGQA